MANLYNQGNIIIITENNCITIKRKDLLTSNIIYKSNNLYYKYNDEYILLFTINNDNIGQACEFREELIDYIEDVENINRFGDTIVDILYLSNKIVEENNLLYDITDYLKHIKNSFKLFIYVCPRQSGITTNLIKNVQFLIVNNIHNRLLCKNINDNNDLLKIFTVNEIEDDILNINDTKKELLELGLNNIIEPLNLDNCLIFYNSKGIKLDHNETIDTLFDILGDNAIFSNSKLYVKSNTLKTFKLFDKIHMYYTR